MLDDKVREFAEEHKVAVYREGNNGEITYWFITDFGNFNRFGKEELFRFWLGLYKDKSVETSKVLFTVLPVENPENYEFLGEKIY
jgi:hypothetical protein